MKSGFIATFRSLNDLLLANIFCQLPVKHMDTLYKFLNTTELPETDMPGQRIEEMALDVWKGLLYEHLVSGGMIKPDRK